jgi:hypothetical protein
MIIDCDRCEVRGEACGDCVVTVLLGPPPGLFEIDSSEQTALAVLADAGLVPPLRLVPGEGHGKSGHEGSETATG